MRPKFKHLAVSMEDLSLKLDQLPLTNLPDDLIVPGNLPFDEDFILKGEKLKDKLLFLFPAREPSARSGGTGGGGGGSSSSATAICPHCHKPIDVVLRPG